MLLAAGPDGCSSSPIGIFDSGVGGLSVLRHMQRALPYERFIYFADAGFAPYGDKSASAISTRSLAVAEFLVTKGIKALVVACNSATAAAVDAIRNTYPALVVIGIEPGLKPAAQQTRTGTIGVFATAATLSSARFGLLLSQIQTEAQNVRFILRACVGLADHVEKGELRSTATLNLLQRHLAPLISADTDTLVLGCTHYPFVRPAIESLLRGSATSMAIMDTGEPVTRQLIKRLVEANLLRAETAASDLQIFTTGNISSVEDAFRRLLNLSVTAQSVKTA